MFWAQSATKDISGVKWKRGKQQAKTKEKDKWVPTGEEGWGVEQCVWRKEREKEGKNNDWKSKMPTGDTQISDEVDE